MKKICNSRYEPHEEMLEYAQDTRSVKIGSRYFGDGGAGIYCGDDFECEKCGHLAKEHKLICHFHEHCCYDRFFEPKWYHKLIGKKPIHELKPLKLTANN